MLHQNFTAEMFVGGEPEASYTPDGRYVVKFPACWSRDADEKIWFECVVWGNIPASDKPTTKELGAFACFVSEYLKEGDRITMQDLFTYTQTGLGDGGRVLGRFAPKDTKIPHGPIGDEQAKYRCLCCPCRRTFHIRCKGAYFETGCQP